MVQKQVTMISRNHEKVAQEVTLMKLNIFEKGVESADCQKVLFNCLKNLEQKKNDLYMPANSNKEIQIKGDKQLIDWTSLVEFLTIKFDELEKERKEKDEFINSLQIEVSFLKVEVKNLEEKQMIRSNTRVEITCWFMDWRKQKLKILMKWF